MDDGELPAFSKKRHPMRELCAVGHIHLMIMFYIFLFDNLGNLKTYVVGE